MAKEDEERNLSYYIDLLKTHICLLYSDNHRKEIAVWSAIVLYLALLSTVLFKVIDYSLAKWSFPYFGILASHIVLAYLFYLFIKIQYRRIQNNMTFINALNKAIFNAMKNHEIDVDINCDIRQKWPDGINELAEEMEGARNILDRGGFYYWRLIKHFRRTIFGRKSKVLNEFSQQEAIMISIFSIVNLIVFIIIFIHPFLNKQ